MSEMEHRHEIPFFSLEELNQWEKDLTNVDIKSLTKLKPEQIADLQARVNDCLQDIQGGKEYIQAGNLAVEKEWEELPEKVKKLVDEIENSL